MSCKIMEWIATRAALTDLEKLLTCSLCQKYLSDPCTLENCDHSFCRKCIEEKLGSDSRCPDCGLFSWLKDLKSNQQLSTTITLTLKLRSLIGSDIKEPICSPNPSPENTVSFNSLGNSSDSYVQVAEPAVNTNALPPGDKMLPEKQYKHQKIKDATQAKMVVKSAERKETFCSQVEYDKKYIFRKKLKQQPSCLRATSSEITSKPAGNSARYEGYYFSNEPLDITSEPVKSSGKHESSDSNMSMNSASEPPNTRKRLKHQGSQFNNKQLNTTSDSAEKNNYFTHLKTKQQNSGDNSKIHDENGEESVADVNKPDGEGKESTIPEEKENLNFELNVKKRRVGKKRSNIKQYLVDKGSLTPSSKIPKHYTPLNHKNTSLCSNTLSSQSSRNKRGETLLHLAAIKGDMLSAQELIKEGSDPNVRDNAGWTPLHEACNHGHVDIVELLLDHGALINIPGFDNDTPLHDAVANGRLKVAKLLVERGATLTARNKQGLIPKDYAATNEMKKVLSPRGSSFNTSKNFETKFESSTLSKVVLGTGLSKRDKDTLEKCVKLLGGTIVSEFSESVTHIVTATNETGHCPRTIKYFAGVLTGKWIVSVKWVTNCFRKRKWICEDDYEVQGTAGTSFYGPKKARYNMTQKLPRLLDGCAFFLRGSFKPPTPMKEDLVKLIKLGGGKILQREPKVKDDDLTSLSSGLVVTSFTRPPEVAYHARANSSISCCTQFIIFDPTLSLRPKIIHSPVLCTAPVTWLMDCISSFELLDIPNIATPDCQNACP